MAHAADLPADAPEFVDKRIIGIASEGQQVDSCWGLSTK